MISDDILSIVFKDTRVRDIPIKYQASMIHALEDAIDKRFFDEKAFTKDEILRELKGD